MTTRLTLIRHGITEWNQQRRYCGWCDIGLSKQGKAQAKRLGKILKSVEFTKIYSSDRKRALQTSRIVFGKRKLIKSSALREMDFGILEGLRHEEILKKYSSFYKKWLKDPYQVRIPKAEAMSAFRKRVNREIKKIVRLNPGKNLAIVCHGGVIAIFVSGIFKSGEFWQYVPKAASLTEIEYRNGKPRVKSFNKTKHLE